VSTHSFVAKAALIDLLQAQTGVGQLLQDVDVDYAYHGNVGARAIYAGGLTFDQAPAVAERNTLMVETVTVGLYMRAVLRPATDVEDTDLLCAAMGAAVGAVLKANPLLAGTLTWTGITGGQADYSRTDDETISVLLYNVQFGAYLAYG
jgi:hypothetical protein